MPPHLIDWAFVLALVTSAVAIGAKWIVPVMQRIGGGDQQDGGTAEWRGRVGAQLDQQDKRLDAMLEAMASNARILGEILRRGEGQEAADRAINTMAPKIDDMAPKVDAILSSIPRRRKS